MCTLKSFGKISTFLTCCELVYADNHCDLPVGWILLQSAYVCAHVSMFLVSTFYFLLAHMQQQTSCMVVCAAKFCRNHLLLLVMSCCLHMCWCVFCCVYFGGMLSLHFSLSAPLFWITYWVKPENPLHICMQLVHTCMQTIAYMYVVYLKKDGHKLDADSLLLLNFFCFVVSVFLFCFYFMTTDLAPCSSFIRCSRFPFSLPCKKSSDNYYNNFYYYYYHLELKLY